MLNFQIVYLVNSDFTVLTKSGLQPLKCTNDLPILTRSFIISFVSTDIYISFVKSDRERFSQRGLFNLYFNIFVNKDMTVLT